MNLSFMCVGGDCVTDIMFVGCSLSNCLLQKYTIECFRNHDGWLSVLFCCMVLSFLVGSYRCYHLSRGDVVVCRFWDVMFVGSGLFPVCFFLLYLFILG